MPEARSNFEEMTGNTSFQRVILDSGPASDNRSAVTKLLFCSGKVYYDLAKERASKNLQADVAITRLEQVPGFYRLLIAKPISAYILEGIPNNKYLLAYMHGKIGVSPKIERGRNYQIIGL